MTKGNPWVLLMLRPNNVRGIPMGAIDSVAQWFHYLQRDLLTGLGAALLRALALFSLAMAEARSCQSGRLAAKARSRALPASSRRRWERLLANPYFDSAAVQAALGRAVAQRWAAPLALLLLDETACGERLRCLKVSLAYRRRALPWAWSGSRRGPRGGQPQAVRRLLRRAAAALPAPTRIVVLADRGLAWPSVVDQCTAAGWSYLLRLQGQARAPARRHGGGAAAVVPAARRRRLVWHGAGLQEGGLAGRPGDRAVAARPARAVAAFDRPVGLPGPLAAVRAADVDRGVVPRREEPGVRLAAQPGLRAGAGRAAAGGVGPGAVAGGEPGRLADQAGLSP